MCFCNLPRAMSWLWVPFWCSCISGVNAYLVASACGDCFWWYWAWFQVHFCIQIFFLHSPQWLLHEVLVSVSDEHDLVQFCNHICFNIHHNLLWNMLMHNNARVLFDFRSEGVSCCTCVKYLFPMIVSMIWGSVLHSVFFIHHNSSCSEVCVADDNGHGLKFSFASRRVLHAYRCTSEYGSGWGSVLHLCVFFWWSWAWFAVQFCIQTHHNVRF